jgi:hypothetical protein
MSAPSDPTETSTPEAESDKARSHHVLARILTVVGVLLLVVSVLANFVKREALDESHLRTTSKALIADPTIQAQLSSTLVDQLYANVDVQSALAAKLPPAVKGLAGPISGAVQEAAPRAAQRLLERPRVQDAFVAATVQAQRSFVRILDGKTKLANTSGGAVTLDLRPLLVGLEDRFSFLSNAQAAIPPNAGQITILKSNQLKTAQNATKVLRFVALWIWVLVIAAWAGAIWLSRDRRRVEVRAIAVGVVAAGLLVLIVRTLAGRYLVNHLVASDTVRPAVARAYSVITQLLSGAGWTGIIIGGIGVLGAWVAGPGGRARATRQALSPYLARPEIAYTALIFLYLLLLWWKPTPQFGFLLNIVLFFIFAVIGLEALRRLTAREFPEATTADPPV